MQSNPTIPLAPHPEADDDDDREGVQLDSLKLRRCIEHQRCRG